MKVPNAIAWNNRALRGHRARDKGSRAAMVWRPLAGYLSARMATLERISRPARSVRWRHTFGA